MDQQTFISLTIFGIFFFIVVMYRYNKAKKVNGVAKEGEYSEEAMYKNVTPMKSDMLQQVVLDAGALFIIFLVVEVIGGYDTFFTWDDFLSFRNFKEFRLSILGGSTISLLGYGLFFQFLLPYFFNYLPKF